LVSVIAATFRVTLLSPTSFQKLNAVEIGKATGIEYQFVFGTKEGLIEKWPERKFKLDGFLIHVRKILQKSYETPWPPPSGGPLEGWLARPGHIVKYIFLVRITEH
jgi:hypothetical protein